MAKKCIAKVSMMFRFINASNRQYISGSPYDLCADILRPMVIVADEDKLIGSKALVIKYYHVVSAIGKTYFKPIRPKYEKPVVIKQANTNKNVASSDFLQSYEWRKIRLIVLKLHGRKCQCCGISPKEGAIMNVDHIKPRKTHPELALDINNLQVLCHECNHGKGNWDTTDFRST